MIHEFAVEPEVMATWNHFRVLWEDFGVSQGRFLVEYPGNWRKRVYALAEKLSAPIRANAICSKLGDREQRHRLAGARGRSFDESRGGWIENATANHGTDGAFRAIVARSHVAGRPDVIAADDLERDAPPWKVERQDKACPRHATEMCRRVGALLRHSQELVLVDRNFDACEPRFTRPFEAFAGLRPDWRRLELHTARPEPFLRGVQEANYRRNLELSVPAGVTLTVCFWPGLPDGERMHPRFVLTERGGVHFDYGLDEGPGRTLVSLLEHEVFLQLRREYRPESRVFGTSEVITITGCG